MTNAIAAYQQSALMSAGKKDLILMFYNAFLARLEKAKKAIEDKDIYTAHENLIKTQLMMEELLRSLDVSVGEIALTFQRIYAFCLEKLVEANMKKDVVLISHVQEIITPLRDAWEKSVVNSEIPPPSTP